MWQRLEIYVHIIFVAHDILEVDPMSKFPWNPQIILGL